MHAPTRLVVRLVRLTGLWAADTPFEPLLTGLPRARPAESVEITVEALDALEAHLHDFATTIFFWFLLGAAGVAFASLTTQVLVYVDIAPLALALFLVAVGVGFLLWVAVFVVFQMRSMKNPAYSFADRLAVSLKRGTLDAAAERTISELPHDSLLRVYFGRLM